MNNSLRSQTLQAFFWVFFERVGNQGIQFVVSIILARLLLPEEFGLLAMLTVFIAVGQTFINSGFGQALIQRENVTHVDECSVFYFNIFLGFLSAGLLCLAAPLISVFYQQPLLGPLTYALSLNLVINAFGVVQVTLLTRHIDFKTQLKIGVIATIISGAIGVAMAFTGFGVWSLVAQSLAANLLHTLMLWVFNSWRPSLVFSLTSLREMFAFGSRLLASGLLDTIFDNIYLIVIGKIFSPVSLGYYTRAKGMQQLIVFNMSDIIRRVTFPVFSKVQNDRPRLKRGIRNALLMLALINFPIMIGLAVVAKPLVLVLLTETWLPCVPYLQLLCVVGLLYPLHVLNLNALSAQGRSDLFFRLEVIKKVTVVLAIIITYRWGVAAMIHGQIFVSVFAYYLNTYYSGKLLDYPMTEQVRDFLPYLAATSIMGVGVYMIRYVAIFSNQLMLLVAQVVAGFVCYAGICYCFRVSAFMEVVAMIKSRKLGVVYTE